MYITLSGTPVTSRQLQLFGCVSGYRQPQQHHQNASTDLSMADSDDQLRLKPLIHQCCQRNSESGNHNILTNQPAPTQKDQSQDEQTPRWTLDRNYATVSENFADAWIEELLMGFHDVAFLPSRANHHTTLPKDNGREESLGTTTCLVTVVGVSMGTLPVSKGTLPVSKGTLPVSKGTLPVSKGTLPVSKGTLPVSKGTLPVYHFCFTKPLFVSVECHGLPKTATKKTLPDKQLCLPSIHTRYTLTCQMA